MTLTYHMSTDLSKQELLIKAFKNTGCDIVLHKLNVHSTASQALQYTILPMNKRYEDKLKKTKPIYIYDSYSIIRI